MKKREAPDFWNKSKTLEKKKYKISPVVVWTCFLLFSLGVNAQKAISLGEEHWDLEPREQVTLDNFSIDNFKDNPAFDYFEDIGEESVWARIRRWPGLLWNKFWDWILAGEEATGLIVWVIKILPYVAVAGMLIVLVWVLANLERDASGKGAMHNSQVRMLSETDIIHHTAIDQLIVQATAAQNYPLAVRYYYLQALQLLTQQGLITWQDQKTNADYMREIPQGNIKDTFAKVTLAYDSIWYGNFEVDERLFSRTVQSFERLRALL
jgi:hypothetical protein